MQTDAVYYFELHSNFQITKVFLKPHVIASSRTVIPTKVRSTAWRNPVHIRRIQVATLAQYDIRAKHGAVSKCKILYNLFKVCKN